MVKYRNEFVKIEVVNNNTLLQVTWYGQVPQDKYQEALNIALEVAMVYKISEWLTDARLIKPISVAAQDWVINDWFPRAYRSGCYNKQTLIPPADIFARSAANRMVYHCEEEIDFYNAYYQ